MTEENSYENVSPLQWAEYEFETLKYDFRIHPVAAEAIHRLMNDIYKQMEQKIRAEKLVSYASGYKDGYSDWFMASVGDQNG